jgi:hypothetical protein
LDGNVYSSTKCYGISDWDKMLQSNKAKRIEVYKNRETQILLSKFLNGEIGELKPIHDPKLGYRYPTVEAITGDSSKVEEFLEKLYNVGILKRRLHDKIALCPKCSSINVSIHYCCPYCKSFDIQRSSLIEHVSCGYMDVEENFQKSDRLVCPKCQNELKKIDVDHRRAGIWCNCKDCTKNFDIPVTVLFCRDCHADSTFEDVTIKDVYAYSMKEDAKQEASLGWLLIAPIRDFLTENGFNVESPAFMTGKSGASHMFDVIAQEEGKTKRLTVIDLAMSTEDTVSEQSVVALFAKIFDVSPDSAYLIAIPKMSDNGKKMAESYNIHVIEAENPEEAIKALKAKMKK